MAPGTPGLAVQTKLCSAATGFSGGQFFVTTLDYTLIVPPNVYAGTYYGTVLYTLSSDSSGRAGQPGDTAAVDAPGTGRPLNHLR